MELHQLEYFVAVAEEASFTRAAAKAHVAQPGVSAQIRRLERELGQQLFDRSGRSVRLTTVGAAVLPHARAALEATTRVRLAVDDLAGLVRGQVTVGMVSGCGSPVLGELLAEFHRSYPAIDIALTEAASDHLLEGLLAGRLDLALIGSAGQPASGVDTAVLADEALVAAVGRDDPLAGRNAVTVAHLRDRALICLPEGTGVRTALERACAAAGFRPRIAFEASALPVVAQLASQGLGVAVVPTSTADAHRGSLHALPISRPSVRSRLELAWASAVATNPAARVLVESARTFVRRTADRRPAA